MKTRRRRPLPNVSTLGHEIISALQTRYGCTRKEVLEMVLRNELARLHTSNGFDPEQREHTDTLAGSIGFVC